jgi:hypothetical protein
VLKVDQVVVLRVLKDLLEQYKGLRVLKVEVVLEEAQVLQELKVLKVHKDPHRIED